MRRFLPLVLGVCGLLGVAGAAAAAEEDLVPLESGTVVASIEPESAEVGGSGPARAEGVPVEGMPFEQALRVETLERVPNAWGVQVLAPTTRGVEEGQKGVATFYARTVRAEDESGEAQVQVYFQRASSPWDKSFNLAVGGGSEWRRFDIPFEVHDTFAAGEAALALGFGFRPQVVEVSPVTLRVFPASTPMDRLPRTRFTYGGREPDAPWRAEAQERIRRLRMGELAVDVRDAEGQPVPGALVRATLERHAFGFGSAIAAPVVAIDPGEEGERATPEEAQRYRELAAELFNIVTIENGLKWGPWESDWFRPRTEETLDWIREQGLRLRGHNLVWPGWDFLPDRVEALKDSPEELRRVVREHVTEEATAVADLVEDWDVVNEPRANQDLMDILGWEEMDEWYRLAHEADPDARLTLNEYSILTGDEGSTLVEMAQGMLDRGVPLTGIGLQGHFGPQPPSIPTIHARLDEVAKLGLPIRITEFDVNTDDPELQADFTRDAMTLLFSHPSVDAFLMWGFWEGAHWKPRAAMYRRDFSIKPNGEAYRKLVFETWHTDEQGVTDDAGRFQTRGFRGDYTVTVTTPDGQTVTVPATLGGEPEPVVVTVE